MFEEKLISIIIPSFNRAHLIEETLNSIKDQTYKYWECIIVDDFSTDDTENVVLKYIENDTRFLYYKKPQSIKRGAPAARNFGLTKSKGYYVNWFDSDDLMKPEKLQTDVENITSGAFDFTISQSDFFNKDKFINTKFWNNNIWSQDPINDFILLKIGWGINSPLWKKAALKSSGLKFDENLVTSNDYLYHIQALQFGLKPICVDEVLVSQREHDGRLMNHKLKSPSKLIVNNYLYKNKDNLNLNTQVKSFLNLQYLRQFSNLLKNKKILLALRFFYKSLSLNYFTRTMIKQVKMLIIGLFYYLFGSGYNKLNG